MAWKNKNGTSERFCKCGSWKDHWLNFSNKEWPEKCSFANCNNKAELGAHIYDTKDHKEFIVPACSSCNKIKEEFNLKTFTRLVSANKSETCEK